MGGLSLLLAGWSTSAVERRLQMVLLQDLHLDSVRTWHGWGRGYEAGLVGRGPTAFSMSADRYHSAIAVQANENKAPRPEKSWRRQRNTSACWSGPMKSGAGRRREHPTGGSDAGVLGDMTVREFETASARRWTRSRRFAGKRTILVRGTGCEASVSRDSGASAFQATENTMQKVLNRITSSLRWRNSVEAPVVMFEWGWDFIRTRVQTASRRRDRWLSRLDFCNSSWDTNTSSVK